MVMTITEMRELKEQKGYTLEEIADRSGVDIELVAKIFYKKDLTLVELKVQLNN